MCPGIGNPRFSLLADNHAMPGVAGVRTGATVEVDQTATRPNQRDNDQQQWLQIWQGCREALNKFISPP